MENLVPLLIDIGLPATVLIFGGHLLYRYFNFKLEMMQKRLEAKLSDKKYIVTGSVTTEYLQKGERNLIDVQILETLQKNEN